MPKIKKKKIKYLKVSDKKKEDIVEEKDNFLIKDLKIEKKKKIDQDNNFEPCYAELKEGVSYTVKNIKFLKNHKVYLTDKKIIDKVSVCSRFEITKGE